MTTNKHHIAPRCGDEDEIRRRLAQAYAFILSWQHKTTGGAGVSQASTAPAASTPGPTVGAHGALSYGC